MRPAGSRGARRLGVLSLAVAFAALAAPTAVGHTVEPGATAPATGSTLATPPPRPVVRDVLPNRMRGRDALDALARNALPVVAEQNGKSVAALTAVLRDDPTAWLDADGRLFHQDTPPPTNLAAEPAPRAARPDSETFRLHSRPGSNRVLYLDFDGYTVAPGSWWQAPGYTALPFDSDGDPTTWSRSDHDAIQYIHEQVAEDYAPFDIDVTTEDPGAAAIGRSSTADRFYGGRVVITNSSSTDFCSPLCGGLSYVGIVDVVGPQHDALQPSWVFNDIGYTAKVLAESSAHEFGHAMGLDHDGQAGGNGYYFGHGMWAPIMGLGYDQPVTQWSRGEYTGANNTEDDFAVAASHGVVALPDETGSSSRPPADLVPGRSQLIGASPSGDVDSWRYVAPCSGTFTFTANVAARGPDLSLELRIADYGGPTLQADAIQPVKVTREFAAGMGATVSRVLTKGSRSTLTVLPLANGTPSTGWSNYANVGRYSFDVASSCEVDDPRPVLLPGSFGTSEGDTGTKTFRIPVTLSAPSTQVVTLDYRPWPSIGTGLATAGVDYASVAPGTLTFLPGETVKTVAVTVLGDTVKEAPLWLGEWFFVRFENPSANARLDTTTFFGMGVGIIGDDD